MSRALTTTPYTTFNEVRFEKNKKLLDRSSHCWVEDLKGNVVFDNNVSSGQCYPSEAHLKLDKLSNVRIYSRYDNLLEKLCLRYWFQEMEMSPSEYVNKLAELNNVSSNDFYLHMLWEYKQ